MGLLSTGLEKEIRRMNGKRYWVIADYGYSAYGRTVEVLGTVDDLGSDPDDVDWEKIHEGSEKKAEVKNGKKERYETPREIESMILEKRVVCGKARSCNIVDGRIRDVYSEDDKKWLRYYEFVSKYKEEKKDVIPKAQKIAISEDMRARRNIKSDTQEITLTTTSTGTEGGASSGTGAEVAVSVPEIVVTANIENKDEKKIEEKAEKVEAKKKVEEKVEAKKKVEEKVEAKKIEVKKEKEENIIDEYIELLF